MHLIEHHPDGQGPKATPHQQHDPAIFTLPTYLVSVHDMQSPIMFPSISSKEAICNAISDLFESSRHVLGEPLLVADLVHQIVGRYEQPLLASEVELEDRTWLQTS